ncbi:hypothetical protein DNTS_030603 [Danionella cerebrum]|uniref:Uncharacterized protein n=1 Tax=Danionella cerebrum TaxID=2873325 RepID=A0A553RHA0_9TELE|nr:hypothetical protein DNTS_030603 [Danionella translucida]TRZ01562.1 hypothetical protein DNTS_030603 [Danionella translucida]TRZ01563.1 hypothetical protein DNTS_030603 [Danionella translucida]TRZ01564.1 hypothetical protein DNTS_030603 [Danionella translucida]
MPPESEKQDDDDDEEENEGGGEHGEEEGLSLPCQPPTRLTSVDVTPRFLSRIVQSSISLNKKSMTGKANQKPRRAISLHKTSGV